MKQRCIAGPSLCERVEPTRLPFGYASERESCRLPDRYFSGYEGDTRMSVAVMSRCTAARHAVISAIRCGFRQSWVRTADEMVWLDRPQVGESIDPRDLSLHTMPAPSAYNAGDILTPTRITAGGTPVYADEVRQGLKTAVVGGTTQHRPQNRRGVLLRHQLCRRFTDLLYYRLGWLTATDRCIDRDATGRKRHETRHRAESGILQQPRLCRRTGPYPHRPRRIRELD